MKLSKASAQAAIALTFLAEQSNDEPVQAREIARHLNIPTDSALKILQTLARGEIIVSTLGRSGGYRILRPAEQITLLNIVEVIDGPVSGVLRLDSAPENFAGSLDRMTAICREAAASTRDQLARVTIAELVRCNRERPAQPQVTTSGTAS